MKNHARLLLAIIPLFPKAHVTWQASPADRRLNDRRIETLKEDNDQSACRPKVPINMLRDSDSMMKGVTTFESSKVFSPDLHWHTAY